MITFKHVNISGSSGHCECCGGYSASGDAIYVNDEMVWEKYFDGHMGGRQTEGTLASCVLNAWYELKEYQLEVDFTEQARLQWQKDKPGSSVASTVADWSERKASQVKMLNNDFEQIAKDCENLPYDELLQMKMIALWIESVSGDPIAIETENLYEDNEDDNLDSSYYTEYD
jgi:hypothetical protein